MQKVEMKLYNINLNKEERGELTLLTTGGRQAARKVLHVISANTDCRSR